MFCDQIYISLNTVIFLTKRYVFKYNKCNRQLLLVPLLFKILYTYQDFFGKIGQKKIQFLPKMADVGIILFDLSTPNGT